MFSRTDRYRGRELTARTDKGGGERLSRTDSSYREKAEHTNTEGES